MAYIILLTNNICNTFTAPLWTTWGTDFPIDIKILTSQHSEHTMHQWGRLRFIHIEDSPRHKKQPIIPRKQSYIVTLILWSSCKITWQTLPAPPPRRRDALCLCSHCWCCSSWFFWATGFIVAVYVVIIVNQTTKHRDVQLTHFHRCPGLGGSRLRGRHDLWVKLRRLFPRFVCNIYIWGEMIGILCMRSWSYHAISGT